MQAAHPQRRHPSYHLPHFYELFALWAYEEDRAFWKEAAKASRDYLSIACHPETGLNPEYGNFDGTPYSVVPGWDKVAHDNFYCGIMGSIAGFISSPLFFAQGQIESHILCSASATPCSAPHSTKRMAAPCHKPPRTIVIIRLRYVRSVPRRLPPSEM